MLNITSDIYRLVADRLRDAVGEAEFFSGTIAVATDVDYTLRATLLIYRRTVSDVSGSWRAISDVVPVWWEFHSTTNEGELLNDFDFAELRRELID
ncbi:MAG: hypothetical protein IKB68_04040 [Rikenellaceae bacterium]|nr:hypothetical protein [Rikenellaceae bacterium]